MIYKWQLVILKDLTVFIMWLQTWIIKPVESGGSQCCSTRPIWQSSHMTLYMRKMRGSQLLSFHCCFHFIDMSHIYVIALCFVFFVIFLSWIKQTRTNKSLGCLSMAVFFLAGVVVLYNPKPSPRCKPLSFLFSSPAKNGAAVAPDFQGRSQSFGGRNKKNWF